MPYRFPRSEANYELFAAGGAFYTAPGITGFPVRLAHELFQRALAIWDAPGSSNRCTLYDPFCGSGYLLATLGYLNGDRLERLIGSDASADALALAARNLSLVTLDGLQRRSDELAALAEQFGKPSHRLALEHAGLLRHRLQRLVHDHPIETRVFQADATDRRAVAAGLAGTPVDLVLADVPYEQRSHWSPQTLALTRGREPIHDVLDALLPVLTEGAVVTVVTPKSVKAAHAQYRQVGKLKLGHRMAVFYRPLPR
jgi:hypothetical protein